MQRETFCLTIEISLVWSKTWNSFRNSVHI